MGVHCVYRGQSHVQHSQFNALSVGETCQTDCHDQRAVQNQLVSSESLPKTGIFAVVAGDFSRNGQRDLRFGSSETGTELQKPANSGLFWSLRGGVIGFGTAWLATQCHSNQSPGQFPANREFNREIRDFGDSET